MILFIVDGYYYYHGGHLTGMYDLSDGATMSSFDLLRNINKDTNTFIIPSRHFKIYNEIVINGTAELLMGLEQKGKLFDLYSAHLTKDPENTFKDAVTGEYNYYHLSEDEVFKGAYLRSPEKSSILISFYIKL